jgi:acetyl-CoA C-acetyltransferase
MRKVAIKGIGQLPVREHWGSPIRHLGVKATIQALKDAQVVKPDGIFVGNMLSGALSQQEHLGALLADYCGFENTEAVKVEAACASGAAALRQAILAVASGRMENAVAVGVEKLTEFSGKFSASALATAADADNEASIGLSFAAINAIMMQRYMYEYHLKREDFAVFPILAHRNAQFNPHAFLRNPITKAEYLMAKPIADPVHLLDSSPIADGAAAVVISSLDEALKQNNKKAIEVAACEIATDTIALDNRENPIWLKAAENSSKKAYAIAGVERKDIHLFEAHDAFSIITALSLEAAGFSEPGRALFDVNIDNMKLNSRLPICTMGGLKGRGHPVGATGIYQVVEAALQLRNEAPKALQLDGLKTAMTQNIGGSGATVITTILKKV